MLPFPLLLLSLILPASEAWSIALSRRSLAWRSTSDISLGIRDAEQVWRTTLSIDPRRRRLSERGALFGEEQDSSGSYDTASEAALDQQPPVYKGPALQDPSQIVAGISLQQLGLDLFVAPSTVVPNQLGVFAMLSEDTERVTLPALTLLCGYSREGTFRVTDEGDKTVIFALGGPNTAVFYQQKLMSILDALELAASSTQDGVCGLAGHVLEQDEDGAVDIYPDNNPEFPRFYVPNIVNHDTHTEVHDGNEEDPLGNLSVQNFGQFCNDLAWNYDDPPTNNDEYTKASEQYNVVQLVWRLEFDAGTNLLVPSWPVSVLARDVSFDNADELYELGTKYGWNYWQATVDIQGM